MQKVNARKNVDRKKLNLPFFDDKRGSKRSSINFNILKEKLLL